MELTAPVARLPVELDVAIPVRDFRVRNLLALEPGQVIETAVGARRGYAAGGGRGATGVERVRGGGFAVGGARDPAGVKSRD